MSSVQIENVSWYKTDNDDSLLGAEVIFRLPNPPMADDEMQSYNHVTVQVRIDRADVSKSFKSLHDEILRVAENAIRGALALSEGKAYESVMDS